MPVYRFKTRYGPHAFEGDPMEFASLADAWKDATRCVGEILRDIDGSLEPDREWRMDVMNAEGQALFSFRVLPETYVEGRRLREP